MRIAAGITTFNRLESLKRCLDKVRAQTRPVDEIIVVDDASHDGTGEWLAEQSDLVVVRAPENRGCSSSFHTVMRTAYERGHDWLFVMDDDAYARPETLERLLEAAQDLQAQGVRVGGLQSFDSNWDTGGPTRVPFSFPSTARQAWRYGHNSREMSVAMGRDAPREIDLYSFWGLLIPRQALGSAGFPDPEFFYWCDVNDLACRQRALGFRHYLVPQAVVEHKGGDFKRQYGQPPKVDWRHYYKHRNRWRFLRMHGHMIGQPMKLVCEVRAIENTLRRAAGAARHGNFYGSRLILKGFLDGVLGRMGKRVTPQPTDEQAQMSSRRPEQQLEHPQRVGQ